MLEVRHVCKTYRPRKGAETKALDDVSVTFPETGMVFILGKSGSGKSTLLNVCGGLDKPDSGEIIIKGRSSADKKDFDFDSYRNTFVGFVFQEYNILEEFTVEENVAIALELQHRKRDKEVIDKILADVEMSDFAARKPNTLSGGQKQRVAIARALVKNPQILMADEPTGALDSATGKQVFDTLRKLSRTKLVLVVSHDREFAEQYADRIIELKDGKIISDLSRGAAAGEEGNLRFVGTDTVYVSSTAALTDEEFAEIRAFLDKNKGRTMITSDREKIGELPQSTAEDGAFAATTAQPVSRAYGEDERKMIRSRLPVRHAARMGASSLKAKPVRLVFTILLSFIAFLMFGIASTLMLYDPDQVTANAFVESDYDYLHIGKNFRLTTTSYRGDKAGGSETNDEETGFDKSELRAWQEKYPEAIVAVDAGNSTVRNLVLSEVLQQFYTENLQYILIDGEQIKLTAGRHAASDTDILVSDYMYRAMKAGALRGVSNGETTDEIISIHSPDDLIGKKLLLGHYQPRTYTICGVYAGQSVPKAYADNQVAADENRRVDNSYDWRSEMEHGMYASVAMKDAAVEALRPSGKDFGIVKDEIRFSQRANAVVREINDSVSQAARWSDAKLRLSIHAADGTSVQTLSARQMFVGHRMYAAYLRERVKAGLEALETTDRKTYDEIAYAYYDGEVTDADGNPVYEYGYGSYEFVPCENELHKEYMDALQRQYSRCAGCGKMYDESLDACTDTTHKWFANEFPAWSEEACPDCGTPLYASSMRNKQRIGVESRLYALTRDAADLSMYAEYVYPFFEAYGQYLPDIPMHVDNPSTGQSEVMTIAGYFIDENSDRAYLSDDAFPVFADLSMYSLYTTAYDFSKNIFAEAIFLPYTHDRAQTKTLLRSMDKVDEYDTYTTLNNDLYESLQGINALVDGLGKLFMIVGLVLAAFSFLLMFNFISASISAKKKEIGILRAIGSRTWDVFKIFLSEALIVAAICFVLATAGSWGACLWINNLLMEESTMIVTGLLIFGPLSALCIAAITLFTAILATVIPVGVYSRKPPVESIRAL